MDEQHEELKKHAAAGTNLPTASPESPRDDESHVETQALSQRNPRCADFWALLALVGGIFAVWLLS